MHLSPRYTTFLKEYQQSSNIYQSAVKAGFSSQYADKQGKLILNRAMKLQAQQMLNKAENNDITAKEGKKLMHELLGLTREEVYENVKWLANQEKDLSTRLKVIQAIAKQLDIDLTQEEQQKTVVPILNVVVDKPREGLTEPPIDARVEG